MTSLQKAARSFALLNVAIGMLGFTGPAVTGNRDRVINLRTGKLLGFVAINWLHALLHLAFGLLGLAWSGRADQARRYMAVDAVLFGLLTVMGVRTVRGQPGIYMMMGMAIDRAGNLIHAAWTALGLAASLQGALGAGRRQVASSMGGRWR